MKRIRSWQTGILLAFVVLAAYLPVRWAGLNSVDDGKLFARLESAPPWAFADIFFPGVKRYYFRPVTISSFYADRALWELTPSFMHLENVLLHLVSALLVFAVTRRLARHYGEHRVAVPAGAALLFGLHPLATEAVCWLSGRTDLLAGVFLLAAVALLLRGLDGGSPWNAVCAAPLLVFAALSKEVAVCALPGLLLLVAVWPGAGAVVRRLPARWPSLVAVTTAGVGYFLWRHLALRSDSGIRTAVKGISAGEEGVELLDRLRVALKVYGFYFKKVLIPWPLNFGIVEISGWYVLAGALLAGLLLLALLRGGVPGAFCLVAFCVLAPALLVVFGKMAWTLIAERYLYVSLAFLAPPAALGCARVHSRLAMPLRRAAEAGMVLLLLLFFATTLHRSWIWQDNLRLYQDTVAKSPGFTAARAELASALLRHGREDEARQILEQLQSVAPDSSYVVDDINLARLLAVQGETDRAYAMLMDKLNASPKRYHEILQTLVFVNDRRIERAKGPAREAIQRENLGWLLEQQRVRPDPFTLYRIGKLHIQLGQREDALAFLRQSLATAPADAYYRGPARTMIDKLEQP